jgi:hypothetical protein
VDELRGVLRGRLRIGPLVPAGEVDVPGLLARFNQSHPGVEVTVREGAPVPRCEACTPPYSGPWRSSGGATATPLPPPGRFIEFVRGETAATTRPT